MLNGVVNGEAGEVLIDSGADYGVVPARVVKKSDYTGWIISLSYSSIVCPCIFLPNISLCVFLIKTLLYAMLSMCKVSCQVIN